MTFQQGHLTIIKLFIYLVFIVIKLFLYYRLLKCDVIKMKFLKSIMGFVRIFWENNVQEAYLPKMSIWGQIVSEIVAQLCLQNSIQTLLNFFWVDPKKN